MSSSRLRGPLPMEQTLGRYTLLRQLARGGMGAVHLAQMRTPQGFAKWVAVKTIHPDLAQREELVTAFLDEARIAARLAHPNICSVFDFGVEDGTYFLVMEYLHGQPLTALLKRTRGLGLPPALAARIIADAARGLHAAHEFQLPDGSPAGVVHRDVSPHNVFVLYDGVAKVVDFGIARYGDRISKETSTGMVKGKVAYMSPEQLNTKRGEVIDRQADVFALGVVLWEALTGRQLFEAESQMQAMLMVLQEEILAPSQVSATAPPALDGIVLRALAREKSKRYATALELARDLERFLAARGEAFTATEVGEYVSEAFAEERRERDAMLRTDTGAHPAMNAADVSSVLRGFSPPAAFPAVTPMVTATVTGTSPVVPTNSGVVTVAAPSKAPWIVAGVLFVILLAVAGLALARTFAAPSAPAALAASAPTGPSSASAAPPVVASAGPTASVAALAPPTTPAAPIAATSAPVGSALPSAASHLRPRRRRGIGYELF